MPNVNKDPFRSFRFLIEMAYGSAVVGAFSQFSGVKFEVEHIEARGGDDLRGVPEGISTLTKFSPVTLTKGVVGDEAFLDWLFSAASGMETGPVFGVGPRTINVVALDDRGERGMVWTLKDAYPIGYELSPMDSASSAVLTESITFSIRGVERRTNGPALMRSGFAPMPDRTTRPFDSYDPYGSYNPYNSYSPYNSYDPYDSDDMYDPYDSDW